MGLEGWEFGVPEELADPIIPSQTWAEGRRQMLHLTRARVAGILAPAASALLPTPQLSCRLPQLPAAALRWGAVAANTPEGQQLHIISWS